MAGYEAPTITELGSLQDLTLGSGTWSKTGSVPDVISPSVSENGTLTLTKNSV